MVASIETLGFIEPGANGLGQGRLGCDPERRIDDVEPMGVVVPGQERGYAIVTDSQAIVDWLDLHLTASQLSTATKTAIKTSIDAKAVTAASSDGDKYDRIHAAVLLVMCCPEYLIQK